MYRATERNRAGGITLDLFTSTGGHFSVDVLSENEYALNSAKDILVTLNQSPSDDAALPESAPDVRMMLFDLRRDTTQMIDHGSWYSKPAIAPDGTALAYLRANQNPSTMSDPASIDLVIFDIAHNTKMTLHMPDAGIVDVTGHQATFWSSGGQRLVAITTSSQGGQASLLARDGTLISTVLLPPVDIFALTNDDQLAMRGGEGLRWLTLNPRVPARPSNVVVAYRKVWSLDLPASRSRPPAPLASATAATPPPVTQLPTPAVHTSLP